MPLVQAKCTNCGANLEVDNTKDAAICPHCGTPYVVEKAIQNYNITNRISAETVNIYGGNSANFVIRAGTLEKYTGAATDVVIPDSVTIIGAEAFKDCAGLTTVIIPNGVTEIRNDAFHGCVRLNSVTIPEGVQTIGSGAFHGCRSLTSIKIPSSIISIGGGGLGFSKDAWDNPLDPYVLNGVFQDCANIENIMISNGVKSLGNGMFFGCKKLTKVVIPGSVESIAGVFFGCANLTNVILMNGVKSIGDSAFCRCTSLHSITIPNSVQTIGNSAFSGCTVLSNLTIPNGVQTIGSSAFSGCTAFRNITIPNGVKTIGSSAFSGCTALHSITIPDSVTKVERSAFSGCINLNTVLASETWKKEHWDVADCLKSYEPFMHKLNNCYIATAVYGSYDCPQVWVLRRYRDNILSQSKPGRVFIRLYYAVSPTLVKWFGGMCWFKKLFRWPLDGFVNHLISKGIADTPYNDG